MTKSEQINELATALNKAQSEMPVALKTSENPFFSKGERKAMYADLAQIIELSTPILTSNGLSISQFPISKEGKIGVTTILMHKNGQWIEGDFLLTPMKEQAKDRGGNPIGEPYVTPQKESACVTYARRYAWQSVIGMAADADDDGNKASGLDKKKPESDDAGIVITESDQIKSHVNDIKILIGRCAKEKEKQERFKSFIIFRYAPPEFKGDKISELPVDVLDSIVKNFKHLQAAFEETEKSK